jgi:hypothetical protein
MVVAYFLRTASFNPPTAFCIFPAVLSVLPSVSSFLLPKIFPADCFTAPLACCADDLLQDFRTVD